MYVNDIARTTEPHKGGPRVKPGTEVVPADLHKTDCPACSPAKRCGPRALMNTYSTSSLACIVPSLSPRDTNPEKIRQINFGYRYCHFCRDSCFLFRFLNCVPRCPPFFRFWFVIRNRFPRCQRHRQSTCNQRGGQRCTQTTRSWQ